MYENLIGIAANVHAYCLDIKSETRSVDRTVTQLVKCNFIRSQKNVCLNLSMWEKWKMIDISQKVTKI